MLLSALLVPYSGGLRLHFEATAVAGCSVAPIADDHALPRQAAQRVEAAVLRVGGVVPGRTLGARRHFGAAPRWVLLDVQLPDIHQPGLITQLDAGSKGPTS